jgi:vesicle coat complex subunit
MTLRCTSSVLAAFPTYLKFDLRIFLPKYHDPIYVKYEKLDLILQIATDENA